MKFIIIFIRTYYLITFLLLQMMPAGAHEAIAFNSIIKSKRIIFPHDSTEADKAWSRYLLVSHVPSGKERGCKPIKDSYNMDLEDRVALRDCTIAGILYRQQTALQIKTAGLAFWLQYPQDARRYQWLLRMSHSGLDGFYTDAMDAANSRLDGVFTSAINLGDLMQWQEQYSKLRLVFLAASEVSEKDKNQLLINELNSYLLLQLYPSVRGGGPLDLTIIEQKILAAAPYYYLHLDTSKAVIRDELEIEISRIFKYRESFGINLADLTEFCTRLQVSGAAFPLLVKTMQQKSELMRLTKIPFEFKAATVTGKVIDIHQFRGKVVLVDFWATWCAGCISYMPILKKAYEKYHDQGLEVLSISIDHQRNRNKVLQVHDRIGVDWPMFIIGNDSDKKINYWTKEGQIYKQTHPSYADKIFEKYGFNTVPQLLLFDRDGKLVALKGELTKGVIDKTIKAALDMYSIID